MNEEVLLQLIALIYDSVSNPEIWTTALEGIQNAINALYGVMYAANIANGQPLGYFASSTSPLIYESLDHSFYASIIPMIKALNENPAEIADTIYQDIGENELKKTVNRNNLSDPFGFSDNLGGIFIQEDALMGVLGFPRGKGQKPYGAAEKRFIQELIPHIKRAFLLQNRLAISSAYGRSMLDILDRLPYGVILLNARGNVLNTNTAAGTLLNISPELDLINGRLQSRNTSVNNRLDSLIDKATTRRKSSNHMRSGGTIVIPQAPPHFPLTIHIDPLRHEALTCEINRDVAVIVFITTLGTTVPDHTHLLQDYFNLSEAEVYVAHEIANGATMEDIAERTNRSKETIRTQLKSIYAKTGVNRQADLVRMLLIGLPPTN